MTDVLWRPPDPITHAPSPAGRQRIRDEYIAIVSVHGDWFGIEIPQLGDGIQAHTTSLRGAADAARDAIALGLNLDPHSFDVRTIVVEGA